MRNYVNRKRILVTGGAGFLGSHLCDRLLEQGHEVLCVDNLFTGTKRNIDHLVIRASSSFDTTLHFRCTSRWTRSTTWHAQPRRLTISTTRYRRPRRRCTVPSTCSAWPSGCVRASSRPPRARSMVTRPSTHRWRATRATSTQLAPDLATTRASAAPRHHFSIISGSTVSRSRWRESSIPMAHGCTRTTGALSRISLCRH